MLGWIGNVLIVVGLWKIGDKWRHAFVFSVLGELAWIARSVAARDWALASICVVFCLMAVRSWVKWGAAEPAPEQPAEPVWVSETFTKHWVGKHGGEAVQVKLKSPGWTGEIVLANHDVARSFGEALIRHADEISRKPTGVIMFDRPLTQEQADELRAWFKARYTGLGGVKSGRELLGPRPSAGPKLCPRCGTEKGDGVYCPHEGE
jgi:hypothetical protein